MKKLLLVLVLIPFTISFGADADPVFEIGAVLTDGGTTEAARSVSLEMNVKRSGDYVNKIRTGYFQWLFDSEIAGLQAWNINQITLLDNWKPYIAGGFGGNNEVLEGDDALRGGFMLEIGCDLFNKVPFGIGGKIYPVEDKGDQVFLYGMLSFNLK